MPRRPRRALAAALLAAHTLAAPALVPAAVHAQPEPSAAIRRVAIDRPSESVPATGTLAFDTVVDVEPGTAYLEVRAQLKRPSGKLLYQRTRVLSDVASSTVRVGFDRGLADLDLEEGAYPLEIRVRAGSSVGRLAETTLDDRVLVYDPSLGRTPLVVVVRVGCAPSLDPEGRFVDDPGEQDRALRSAEELVALVARRPGVHLSVALPPVLVEQWQRAADGYSLANAAGVAEIPRSDPAAARHRTGLERVAAIGDTDRVELLDVPFADPDLVGLASVGALDDLGPHYARGRSVYLGALQTTPTHGTLIAGGFLPARAAGGLASAEISYAVLAPGTFTTPRGLAGGVWRVRDTTLTALVTDPLLCDTLGAQNATPGVAVDRLFALRRSLGTTTPVTVVVEIGPGRDADLAGLAAALDGLAAGGWTRTVTAADAVTSPPRGSLALAALPLRAGDGAPQGYWDDVAEARISALALWNAAGGQDADAEAAVWSLMLSESHCWSGADGSWALADRGRAFASAALRRSGAILDAVRLEVSDVTLSGTAGKVPIVVVNGSDKTLRLRLETSSRGLVVGEPLQELTVAPSDNYATISVDLRGAISSEMSIALSAGDLVLDERTVAVRATVLDRLVVIAAVAIVLAGLLFYVWRGSASSRGVSGTRDAGRIRGNSRWEPPRRRAHDDEEAT